MIEGVKKKLAGRKDISEWILREERQQGFQIYLARGDTESIRKVEDHFVLITVIHADGKRAGWTPVRVYRHELDRLDAYLDEAVQIASMAQNHPFRLPLAETYPDVPLADDTILEQMEEAATRVQEEMVEASTALPEAAEITGAEIHLVRNEKRLILSNGSGHEHVETRVVFDCPVIATRKEGESERWLSFEGRRVDEIPSREILIRYAEEAIDKVVGRPPATGTKPVIIRGKELLPLFDPLVYHGSMKAKVEGTSLLEPGKSAFENIRGDRLNLYGDPLEPYGLRSEPYCSFGTPSRRHMLIEEGIFVDFWGTPEHAAKLNRPPTGCFGNVAIEGGNRSEAELLDGDEPILEIVNFSDLVADPQTGTFMGEIRLGYEIRGEEKKPIVGGSVSGSVFSLFANLKLSAGIVKTSGYHGPSLIRFEDVMVAGD
jgi:predicted Zn-dependent protease